MTLGEILAVSVIGWYSLCLGISFQEL